MADLDRRMSAPDLISPVAAFRHWRIVDGELRSRHSNRLWPSRVLHATCEPRTAEDFARGPHQAPHPDCSCGVHVYFDPPTETPRVDFRAVSGIVTVWGHVAVHADGMRAEYARVEALGIYPRWTRRQQEAVMRVAAEFEVHVHDLADLAAVAGDYAPPLPPALRTSAPRPRQGATLRRSRPKVAERSVLIGH